MSILANYIVNQALGRNRGNEGAQDEQTRKNYEKLLSEALKAGNQKQLLDLASGYTGAGGDPAPFLNAAGQLAPEQQLNNLFNQMLGESLGVSKPTKERSPFDAVNVPGTDDQLTTPSTPAKNALEELFTPEFAARMATRKSTGIDIGEHTPNQRADWFGSLREMQQANPQASMEELFDANLMKHGWAPEEATHLKGLPEYRREAISESIFGKYFNDPEVRAVFGRAFPNIDQDKGLAGFVLNTMRKSELAIPKRLQPFLDRFDGLHDDFQDIQAEKTINEAIAKERAAQITFSGELSREAQKAETMRGINKPRLPQGAVESLKGAQNSVDLAKRAVADIENFVRTPSGEIDLERLPVGPIGEPFRKRMDKYGIMADEARIRLRTTAIKLLKTMYAVQGKQLSDKEIALTMQEYVSMNDSPLQFVTKFSEFQRNIIADAKNTISTFKAAGYDTAGLEPMIEALNQVPILDQQLKAQSSEKSTPAPSKAPTEVVDILKQLKPGAVISKDGKTGWTLDESGNAIQVQVQE